MYFLVVITKDKVIRLIDYTDQTTAKYGQELQREQGKETIIISAKNLTDCTCKLQKAGYKI